MAISYVVDASALARLFLDQPGALDFEGWYDERLRQRSRFFAPGVLPYELANVLHREQGRGPKRADPHHLIEILRDTLEGVHLDADAWARTWRWSDRLSAFDASYLGLAVAKDATLVTYDRLLTEVAREHVPVIGCDGLD